MQRASFYRFGVCLGLDASTFYGKAANKPMSPTELEAARGVCRYCPIRQQCLADALVTDEPFGIWGGFTRPERERIVTKYAPKKLHGSPDAATAAVPRALAAMFTGELEKAVIILQAPARR